MAHGNRPRLALPRQVIPLKDNLHRIFRLSQGETGQQIRGTSDAKEVEGGFI